MPEGSTALSRAEIFERLKIAVRERPLSEEEKAHVQVMLRTDNDKLIAFYPESKEGLVYNYDLFFPEEATQDDVFQSVGREMVDLVVGGYSSNCVVFGPSASGKTHTLFGSDHEPGLIQAATKMLFRRLEESGDDYEHRVYLTYWEMNSDQVKDALNVQNPKPLNVRRTPLGFQVVNLTQVEVHSWDHLDEYLMQGNIKRIQLSEERNARWHGFVKLTVESTDRETAGQMVTRTMTFAQLKGPDRVGQKGARGDVLVHGSNINKSISLLCSAILHAVEFRRKGIVKVTDESEHRKLIEKSQSFFMESKFTQLMSQLLCGTEACFLVGTVCGLDYHEATDALENLQNAQQLTASLKRNETLTERGKMMKQLSKEEGRLPPSTLAEGHPLSELEEHVQRLRDRLAGAAPSIPEQQRTTSIPEPVVPGELQKWKQSVIKSKIHGDRARIYIPTTAKGKPNTYEGQWSKGRREGFGEHITGNTKYKGEFRGGLRDGEGTLWTRPDEASEWVRVYKGGWRMNKRHGRGVNYYHNGDIYDGFFEDGLRSTIGKLYFANGDRVEGQFRKDVIEGWATLYCKTGDWFEGHWRDHMREGPGVWYYESRQQCYRGEWSKSIPKFGVLEDFPNKETWSKSSFVPRVGLQDYQSVLEKQRASLNDARLREHGEEWCAYEPIDEDPYGGEDDGIDEDADERDDHHASQDGVQWSS